MRGRGYWWMAAGLVLAALSLAVFGAAVATAVVGLGAVSMNVPAAETSEVGSRSTSPLHVHRVMPAPSGVGVLSEIHCCPADPKPTPAPARWPSGPRTRERRPRS